MRPICVALSIIVLEGCQNSSDMELNPPDPPAKAAQETEAYEYGFPEEKRCGEWGNTS